MSLIEVVIPACGSPDLTIECLTHLERHAKNLLGTVWCMDNGSDDETVAAVRVAAKFLGLRFTLWRLPTNVGFTAAVSRGMYFSRYDRHVLILNNDCFVGPHCLQRMLGHLEANPKAAAINPLTSDDGTFSLCRRTRCDQAGIPGPVKDGADFDDVVPLLEKHEVRKERGLAFYCTLIRAEAIRDVGYLNTHPAFASGLGADDEWCRRAVSKGWELLLGLDCYARHLRGETFRRLGLDRTELGRVAAQELKKT